MDTLGPANFGTNIYRGCPFWATELVLYREVICIASFIQSVL